MSALPTVGRKTTFQTTTYPWLFVCGRTRASAPTTLYQSLRLLLFLTSFRPKRKRSGEIPHGCHPTTSLLNHFSTFKALRGLGHSRKCPSDFLVLFLRLKKNIYFSFSFLKKIFVTILKVSHSGSAFSPPEKSRFSFHFSSKEKTFSLFLSQRKGLLLF